MVTYCHSSSPSLHWIKINIILYDFAPPAPDVDYTYQ
jgi:hypothetical protein